MVKMHASYELTWQLSVFLFICVRVRDIDRDGNSHVRLFSSTLKNASKHGTPLVKYMMA